MMAKSKYHEEEVRWPNWAHCVGCYEKAFADEQRNLLELYEARDFYVLPCAHVVCSSQCLQACRHIPGNIAENPEGKSTCPTCFGGFIESEIVQTKTIRPLEVMGRVAPQTVRLNKRCQGCIRPHAQALKFCEECAIALCQFCIKHHSVIIESAQHSVINSPHVFDVVPTSEVCGVHQTYRLMSYCNTCDLQLCQRCKSGDGEINHDKHDVCDLKEFTQNAIKDLQTLRVEHNKMMDGLKTSHGSLLQKVQTLEERSNKIQDDTTVTLENILSLIDQREHDVTEDIVVAVTFQVFRINLRQKCYKSLIRQAEVFQLLIKIFNFVEMPHNKGKFGLIHQFYSLLKEQVQYVKTIKNNVNAEPVGEICMTEDIGTTYNAIEKLGQPQLCSSPIPPAPETEDAQFTTNIMTLEETPVECNAVVECSNSTSTVELSTDITPCPNDIGLEMEIRSTTPHEPEHQYQHTSTSVPKLSTLTQDINPSPPTVVPAQGISNHQTSEDESYIHHLVSNRGDDSPSLPIAFFVEEDDDSSDEEIRRKIKTEPIDYDERDEEPPDDDENYGDDAPLIIAEKELSFDTQQEEEYISSTNRTTPFSELQNDRTFRSTVGSSICRSSSNTSSEDDQNGDKQTELVSCPQSVRDTAHLLRMIKLEPEENNHNLNITQEQECYTDLSVVDRSSKNITKSIMISSIQNKETELNEHELMNELILPHAPSPFSDTTASDDEFFKNLNPEFSCSTDEDDAEPTETLDPETGLLVQRDSGSLVNLLPNIIDQSAQLSNNCVQEAPTTDAIEKQKSINITTSEYTRAEAANILVSLGDGKVGAPVIGLITSSASSKSKTSTTTKSFDQIVSSTIKISSSKNIVDEPLSTTTEQLSKGNAIVASSFQGTPINVKSAVTSTTSLNTPQQKQDSPNQVNSSFPFPPSPNLEKFVQYSLQENEKTGGSNNALSQAMPPSVVTAETTQTTLVNIDASHPSSSKVVNSPLKKSVLPGQVLEAKISTLYKKAEYSEPQIRLTPNFESQPQTSIQSLPVSDSSIKPKPQTSKINNAPTPRAEGQNIMPRPITPNRPIKQEIPTTPKRVVVEFSTTPDTPNELHSKVKATLSAQVPSDSPTRVGRQRSLQGKDSTLTTLPPTFPLQEMVVPPVSKKPTASVEPLLCSDTPVGSDTIASRLRPRSRSPKKTPGSEQVETPNPSQTLPRPRPRPLKRKSRVGMICTSVEIQTDAPSVLSTATELSASNSVPSTSNSVPSTSNFVPSTSINIKKEPISYYEKAMDSKISQLSFKPTQFLPQPQASVSSTLRKSPASSVPSVVKKASESLLLQNPQHDKVQRVSVIIQPQLKDTPIEKSQSGLQQPSNQKTIESKFDELLRSKTKNMGTESIVGRLPEVVHQNTIIFPKDVSISRVIPFTKVPSSGKEICNPGENVNVSKLSVERVVRKSLPVPTITRENLPTNIRTTIQLDSKQLPQKTGPVIPRRGVMGPPSGKILQKPRITEPQPNFTTASQMVFNGGKTRPVGMPNYQPIQTTRVQLKLPAVTPGMPTRCPELDRPVDPARYLGHQIKPRTENSTVSRSTQPQLVGPISTPRLIPTIGSKQPITVKTGKGVPQVTGQHYTKSASIGNGTTGANSSVGIGGIDYIVVRRVESVGTKSMMPNTTIAVSKKTHLPISQRLESIQQVQGKVVAQQGNEHHTKSFSPDSTLLTSNTISLVPPTPTLAPASKFVTTVGTSSTPVTSPKNILPVSSQFPSYKIPTIQTPSTVQLSSSITTKTAIVTPISLSASITPTISTPISQMSVSVIPTLAVPTPKNSASVTPTIAASSLQIPSISVTTAIPTPISQIPNSLIPIDSASFLSKNTITTASSPVSPLASVTHNVMMTLLPTSITNKVETVRESISEIGSFPGPFPPSLKTVNTNVINISMLDSPGSAASLSPQTSVYPKIPEVIKTTIRESLTTTTAESLLDDPQPIMNQGSPKSPKVKPLKKRKRISSGRISVGDELDEFEENEFESINSDSDTSYRPNVKKRRMKTFMREAKRSNRERKKVVKDGYIDSDAAIKSHMADAERERKLDMLRVPEKPRRLKSDRISSRPRTSYDPVVDESEGPINDPTRPYPDKTLAMSNSIDDDVVDDDQESTTETCGSEIFSNDSVTNSTSLLNNSQITKDSARGSATVKINHNSLMMQPKFPVRSSSDPANKYNIPPKKRIRFPSYAEVTETEKLSMADQEVESAVHIVVTSHEDEPSSTLNPVNEGEKINISSNDPKPINIQTGKMECASSLILLKAATRTEDSIGVLPTESESEIIPPTLSNVEREKQPDNDSLQEVGIGTVNLQVDIPSISAAHDAVQKIPVDSSRSITRTGDNMQKSQSSPNRIFKSRNQSNATEALNKTTYKNVYGSLFTTLPDINKTSQKSKKIVPGKRKRGRPLGWRKDPSLAWGHSKNKQKKIKEKSPVNSQSHQIRTQNIKSEVPENDSDFDFNSEDEVAPPSRSPVESESSMTRRLNRRSNSMELRERSPINENPVSSRKSSRIDSPTRWTAKLVRTRSHSMESSCQNPPTRQGRGRTQSPMSGGHTKIILTRKKSTPLSTPSSTPNRPSTPGSVYSYKCSPREQSRDRKSRNGDGGTPRKRGRPRNNAERPSSSKAPQERRKPGRPRKNVSLSDPPTSSKIKQTMSSVVTEDRQSVDP